MHYDVEGNLDINIKDFEEHINQAKEKLEEFEKNFKQLAEIKSSNQMDSLIETVQKIREEIKGANTEGQKLDESFKDIKQSAKGTSSVMRNVGKSVDKVAEKTEKLNSKVQSFGENSSVSVMEALKNFAEYNEALIKTENEIDEINAKIKENAKLYKEAARGYDRTRGELMGIEVRGRTDENGKEIFGTPYHEEVKEKFKYYDKLRNERKQELADLGKRLTQLKKEESELNHLYQKWTLIHELLDDTEPISRQQKSFKNFEKTVQMVTNQINKLETKLRVLEGLDELNPNQQKMVERLKKDLNERKKYLNELNDVYSILGIGAEEFGNKSTIAAEKTTEEVIKLKEEITSLDDVFSSSKIDDKLNETAQNVKNEVKIIADSFTHIDDKLNIETIGTQLNHLTEKLRVASNESKSSTEKIEQSFIELDDSVGARVESINAEMSKLESEINSRIKSLESISTKMSKLGKEFKSEKESYDFFLLRDGMTQSGAVPRIRRMTDIKEEMGYLQRYIQDELKYINELKEEYASLDKEKKKVFSSNSGSQNLLYDLKNSVNNLRKLKSEMKSFLSTEVSSIGMTFEELGLERLSGTDEWERVKESLDKIVFEFVETRDKITRILKQLETDYGITLNNISSKTKDALKIDPSLLTEGLTEATKSITPYITELENKLNSVKRKLNDRKELYEKKSRELTWRAGVMHSTMSRRKDGKYRNNDKNRRIIEDMEYRSRELDRILYDSEYQEHYSGYGSFKGSISSLRDELILLERELERVKSLKNSFIETNTSGIQGLTEYISILENKLNAIHEKMKYTVSSARSRREWVNEEISKGDIENAEISEELLEDKISSLKKYRDEYKLLKSEIDELKETLKTLKGEQYDAWRVEELEPFVQMMNQIISETEKEIDILNELDSKNSDVWNTSSIEHYYNSINEVASIQSKLWQSSELESYYKMIEAITGATKEQVSVLERAAMIEKELYSSDNKFFNLSSPYSKETSMWINEQITDFNNLWRAYGKYHNELKEGRKTVIEYFQAMNGFQTRNKHATSNLPVGFAGLESFDKAIKGAEEYEQRINSLKSSFKSMESMNFNETLGIDSIDDTKLRIVEENISRIKNTFASMNINPLKEAISSVNDAKFKDSVRYIKEMNQNIKEQKLLMKEETGKIGFAGTNEFNKMISSLKEYETHSGLASRSTYKLEESLTSMASASDTAGSRVSTLGGILRTLRTTLSMIGGMFVWDFAFKILDATKATISAKSEMESFFTTLKWGTKDINTFNASLDRTIKKFPKMNKFQLGETIASLGVEFNLSAEEMEQIGNVAPMIVNEYLRAGRKTEEAILAIKDISQGEFLRLSRETGVGKEELKAAGWNGDNKDILNLYQALEKVGKSRHWDSFASKATSINDVMMITENRMTEFATMISDWFTPVIVNGFNLLGDTFEGSRKWLESLSPLNKSLVSVTGAIVGFSTAAWGMHSKVVPALKNVGSTILSNVLGVDKAIIQTHGLSSAIAQQTIVEKARNIAFKEGNLILDQKIRKGIAEAEASKLGMEATELQTVYEKMYADTLKVTRGEMALADAETKSRKLTQEALLLAEKECITVEEAHALIMEREKIANMGTLKSIIAYKLGLDMSIASQSGLATAIGVKLGVMTVEETETGILTTLNWGLVASYIALLAPLALVAAAIVLLVADFMDLCASYDDFNDRLVNGKDRIDELDKKYKAYHKTAQEVEQKQKEGKATQEELTRAREEEKWALINLEKAQSDYNRSLQVSNYFQKTTDESSAKRIESTKKQLEELAKKQGLPSNYYLKDYNQELTRAEQATYDATQNLGWRTAQFEKDIKKISDPKLVKQFKNATDAYEEAKYKIDAPDSDMMDRVFGHIEAWSIGLEIESIKFQNDPDTWFKEFAKNNAPTFDVIGEMFRNMPISATSIANIIIKDRFKKVWEEVTASFTSWSIPTNQWLNSLLPDLSVDDFKSWFGTHVREPLQQFFSNPFGSGDVPMGNKTFDISNLLKVSAEGIAKIGDELWSALDQYLSNHVPMYGWIKQIMPKEEATAQGQQTGNGLFEGFKTGISPVDNLIQTAGNTWSSLSFLNGQKVKNNTGTGLNGIKTTVKSHLDKVGAALSSSGNQWGTSAHTSGGKIKTGVKDGSQGMDSPVKSEISDISSSLQGAGGSWFSMALASAKQIVGGIVKGLNRKSPGDGAKTVLQEMIDAGNFIAQQSPILYAQSQQAGQSIVRGMQDMNLGQQLANTYNTMSGASNNVIGLNQATMNNTIGTYNYLSSKVNSTFGSIDDTITTTDDSINKSFNAMNLSATKSFTDMSLNATSTMQNTVTSNQMHLNSMQSSTLSTTKAMVSAWNSMKNHIVSSAKYIQSTSYSRFSSLHRSISSFYNQLANAHFSAGLPTGNSSLSRGRNLIIGRNRNTGGRIKAKSSKRIGNVYGSRDKGLRQAHIDRIKNTSNSWEIGDPWFLGIRIPMNNHVRDFDNGKTVRVNTGNFESILRDILTARGFGNPNTYQYYANSRRSNQQVWDDVRCNCYDGAELIVEIGQMLGLSGHLVHGSWKGEGHMGAMVGGKLYDMTQFQKRGVFRGTSGVSFGTRGNGAARGSSEREVTKKEVTINVTNDLSNARIYGIDDLDNHIKEATKKTYYELNSPDGAVGY